MSGIGHYARATPDAVALISPGSTRTFSELDARQRSLAGALKNLGIARGDRIAILSTNRMEFLEVTISCLRAGIVPVPVNRLLTLGEIGYILDDSGARVLFRDLGTDRGAPEHVVTFGDAYERLLSESEPADLDDHVLGRPMHYTSGTTGRPKGVWVSPSSSETAERASKAFRELWQLSNDEAHLVCSPLSHSAPHRFAVRTLEAGGRVVVQERFDAEETIASIELFGITSTFMVPTHLERLIGLGQRVLGRHDLSTMRLLVHAGAPIREATKHAAIDLFPTGSVWEFYGSTEGQATRISTPEWLAHPGSVGRALPGGRIEIKDESGETVGPGTVGEVWVKDPSGERFEYWSDEAKTRSARRGDLFTVGDLGYLDDDGYLFLTARKHDTIITGGVNVYPAEVESILTEHPAVKEAMVYGVDDEEWGQQVRAMIVPEFGQPLDLDLLRAWAREHMASYKCPRVIEVVNELPRTATGKLQRNLSP